MRKNDTSFNAEKSYRIFEFTWQKRKLNERLYKKHFMQLFYKHLVVINFLPTNVTKKDAHKI